MLSATLIPLADNPRFAVGESGTVTAVAVARVNIATATAVLVRGKDFAFMKRSSQTEP
jgi:hypothetical protein